MLLFRLGDHLLEGLRVGHTRRLNKLLHAHLKQGPIHADTYAIPIHVDIDFCTIDMSVLVLVHIHTYEHTHVLTHLQMYAWACTIYVSTLIHAHTYACRYRKYFSGVPKCIKLYIHQTGECHN